MAIDAVRDSSVPRNASSKASAESSTSDGAMSARRQPREATPKGGTQLLAVCATPGQLDHFAALVLQQRAKQSALRKGRGGCRNVISSAFHKRLTTPFTSELRLD
jgi:hypothetical protein